MANKKGANGTGSMHYDKKRKLYIYRVSIGFDEQGRQVRKSFSAKTQAGVLAKHQEWARKGSFVSIDPDILMNDWCDAWFGDYKQKVELSTAATYKYTLKHIKENLGRMKVHDMRAVHVEHFLAQMAELYSISQVSKIRAMLGQILRKAEANQLVDKNPVPLADHTNYRRMGKKQQPKKDAYTADEVLVLMQQLPNTRIGHSVRLMLGTGISTQELLGLSAFDIAPDGSKVSIRRAVKVKEGGGIYIGDVKAEHRDREVYVPASAQPSAIFLRNNADGYIIRGQKKGMPINPSTYRKYYKAALNRIQDVRTLTPHCCRHTYISHLEDLQTDFAVIQALAGQSEKQSTIQYIHPQSPSITAAVGKIEALLSGK